MCLSIFKHTLSGRIYMDTLIIVDMQRDFVTGPLGTDEARAIVPKIQEKIKEYEQNSAAIIFTRDTHGINYLETQEGKRLPVEHCIINTEGWELIDELKTRNAMAYVDKETFGWLGWEQLRWIIGNGSIELVGVCTDICVVVNALILKTVYPENIIKIDASCCAGTTVEAHKTALQTMKSCQIDVIGE